METNKNYIYRYIAGEHLLIPVADEAQKKVGLYTLTDLGGEIWELISDGKNIDEIIDILFQEYDVEKSRLSNDVKSFIDKLISDGLISD